MKRSPTHQETEPAEFEILEARLLLDATHFVQPDGPMPQTAGPDAPPVVEAGVWDDADIVHVAADPSPGYDFDLDFDDWVWFGQDVRDEIAQHDGGVSSAAQVADQSQDDPVGGEVDALACVTAPHRDGVIIEFRSGDDAGGGEEDSFVSATRPHHDGVTIGRAVSYGAALDTSNVWDDTDIVHVLASAADADGDGKLGLNDAQAAAEPTSLTFNGRGIDLNEDEMVGADGIVVRMVGVDQYVATAEADGLGGGISLVNGEFDYAVGVTGDGKITPWERCQLPTTLAYEPVWAIGTDGTISYMIGIHDSGYDCGAGRCKIMAVRVANPEGSAPSGGPLGAVMGGIGGILGGAQPGGIEPQGLSDGTYEVEIWFGGR